VEGVTDTPETQPHPDATPSPRTARRSVLAALLLGAAGAALVLLASSRTWLHGHAPFPGARVGLPVHAGGGDVTGVPGALALVGLAALVAVFAVRGAARIGVSGLLALSGAGTAAAALLSAHDGSALDDAAATATGVAGATATGVTTTAWPLITALGGAALLAAGLIALARGRAWPAMSTRYERSPGRRGGTGAASTPGPRRPRPAARRDPALADHPSELWRALDRGEDPTTG
jgi:uncharacterized membrane protein (TIGR02234 family)